MTKRAYSTGAQNGFNLIFLVPVNLYGPGDNFHPEHSHVIPVLICQYVEAVEEGKDEVMAWGTGQVSREFLYVEAQKGPLVQHPTARWVFQYFVGIHLLRIRGEGAFVLNLNDQHLHLLRLLGRPYEAFYS